MVFLVVFTVANKEHDIKLQNVSGIIATVFLKETLIYIYISFEYTHKAEKIGVGYNKEIML